MTIKPGEQVPYVWEYTDTYGGEANYSWVRRGLVHVPASFQGDDNRTSARRIKRAAGLSGVRGRSEWYGDTYTFRPYRSCTVLFAAFHDCFGRPCEFCR